MNGPAVDRSPPAKFSSLHRRKPKRDKDGNMGFSENECFSFPLEKDSARVSSEVKLTSYASIELDALRSKCGEVNLKEEQVDGELSLKLKTSEKTDMKIGVEAIPEQGLTTKGTFNLKF